MGQAWYVGGGAVGVTWLEKGAGALMVALCGRIMGKCITTNDYFRLEAEGHRRYRCKVVIYSGQSKDGAYRPQAGGKAWSSTVRQ